MNYVRAKEVTIPAFGMLIRRKLRIVCGNCGITFEDKPAVAEDMYSKCPFCKAINKLPITKA